MWVRAMDLYANVFRTVQPKREKYDLNLVVIFIVTFICLIIKREA